MLNKATQSQKIETPACMRTTLILRVHPSSKITLENNKKTIGDLSRLSGPYSSQRKNDFGPRDIKFNNIQSHGLRLTRSKWVLVSNPLYTSNLNGSECL